MVQKTVLITGCSEGGIGDALAKEFHRKGLRVFATARNLSKVEHLKEVGIDVLPLDVVDETSIRTAVDSVQKTTGGTLDFLVNNSGSGYSLPLLDTEVSVAKKMFDVNVFAIIAVIQAFSPLLFASKGTIINIGSIAGKFPVPWQGYYNASKAAVNLLSDQLRIELKPFDVKIITVITGTIETKFFENQPPVKLPANSPYSPWREQVEVVADGGIAKKDWIPVDEYAQAVVKNALKTSPQVNQWAGGSASLIWFLSTFMWHTFWDLSIPIVFKFPNWRRKSEAVVTK